MPDDETSVPAGLADGHAVEIVLVDPRWVDVVDPWLLQACADAAAHFAGGNAALALDADARVAALNGQFRGQAKPTNVLSFPSAAMPVTDGGERFLGDVILAFETVMREAAERALSATHHACHLAVHGILHLAGYDHDDDIAAERMERAEAALLARFAIADPYAEMPVEPKAAL